MNHGLSNDFLCAACKIEVYFEDDLKTKKSGSGTAFIVKKTNGEICLLTNRHVVDLDYKKPTAKYKNFKLVKVVIHNKKKDKTTGLPTESHDLLILNHKDFIFSSKVENDVACLRNIQAIDLKGIEPQISFFIDEAMIADKQRLNEKLVVCDFVAFPGFPDWYDKKNNLPILRTGTIASDPRFDYSYTGSDDGEVIAYEAFSFGGSSGSPVFAIAKGIKVGGGLSGGGFREIMLVGINAGHLPIQGVTESHSGISYFYKSTVILELIEK
jgi:hypothetical protein